NQLLLIWAIVLFSVKHGPGICLCHGPWTCNLDENVMKYVSYTVLYYYSGTLRWCFYSLSFYETVVGEGYFVARPVWILMNANLYLVKLSCCSF
ncbi:hypothetical protein ERO13_D01G111233v2, partial [Gossypium hirsutum]